MLQFCSSHDWSLALCLNVGSGKIRFEIELTDSNRASPSADSMKRKLTGFDQLVNETCRNA